MLQLLSFAKLIFPSPAFRNPALLLTLLLLTGCASFSGSCPVLKVAYGLEKISRNSATAEIVQVSGDCEVNETHFTSEITVRIETLNPAGGTLRNWQALLRVASLSPKGTIVGMSSQLLNISGGITKRDLTIVVDPQAIDFPPSALQIIVALIP